MTQQQAYADKWVGSAERECAVCGKVGCLPRTAVCRSCNANPVPFDVPYVASVPEWRRRAAEQVERFGFIAVADLTGKGL